MEAKDRPAWSTYSIGYGEASFDSYLKKIKDKKKATRAVYDSIELPRR